MKTTLLISSFVLGTAFGSMAQQEPDHLIARGQSVTLKANAQNALSYIWFKDGEPILGTNDMRLIVNETGTYTVIAINGGCESDASDPVEVIIDTETPVAQIDMQIRKEVDEGTILVGDEFDYQLYIVNNSEHEATGIKVVDRLPSALGYQRALLGYTGTVNYDADRHEVIWEPDNLMAGQTEELRIRVLAKEGGMTENTAEVNAKEADPDRFNNTALARKEVFLFKIPNVFTPNGDGMNDRFVISGLELFPENELMIYSRWGSQIYHRKGYQNDWDGQNLMEGTYYYIFRVKMRDNKWKIFKGPIAILYETFK